jgi:hypothetical protein
VQGLFADVEITYPVRRKCDSGINTLSTRKVVVTPLVGLLFSLR